MIDSYADLASILMLDRPRSEKLAGELGVKSKDQTVGTLTNDFF